MSLQLDVDQAFRRARRRTARLRSTPVIDVGDLVHTGHGAVRRAALGVGELAPDVGLCVLRYGHAWVPTLL